MRLSELAGQMGPAEAGLLCGLRNRFGITVDKGVDSRADLFVMRFSWAGFSAGSAVAGGWSSSRAPWRPDWKGPDAVSGDRKIAGRHGFGICSHPRHPGSSRVGDLAIANGKRQRTDQSGNEKPGKPAWR